MIAVAGLWELGWNTPIKEAELWEYPLRDFKVDCWFMAPVSGIQCPLVTEVEELSDVIRDYRNKGVPVVFVDERGTTPLHVFQHPANVLYVFGKASLSPLMAYGQPSECSVVVETAQDKGLLWPHQALSILLYDRQVKSWR